jgi:hypothetical protein
MRYGRNVRVVYTVLSLLLVLGAWLSVRPPGTIGVVAAGSTTPLPPPDSLVGPPQEASNLQQAKPPAAKLDSALTALVAETGSTQRLAATDEGLVVHLAINPADAATVRSAVAEAGGEVTITSVDGATLQAWVPIAALAPLATLPEIQMLRQPPALATNEASLASGAFTSEALPLLGVNPWHAAGITGQGIEIGVIENDFQGYEELIGTELPPAERLVYENFADPRSTWGRSNYGTAQAEVIHDIVPDAALYLARVTNHLEFEQAAEWMRSQGVDVIASYLGWYNLDPGDGTGFLADVVNRTQAAGVTWITGAQHVRTQHWGGNSADSNGDRYLEVESPLQINPFIYPLAAGEQIDAYARWNDWDAVNQDVELVIVRWNGEVWQVYAESTDYQNGLPGQTPTESLSTITSGATTYYGVALRAYRVDRPLNVDVFTYNHPFWTPTYERSLLNLGDVPAGITVGVIDARAPYRFQEYSGQGPTNGLGGARDGGTLKPDLVSYAGVSTATFREFGWSGAAVAHVGGIAALLKSAYPDASPTAIRAFLQERAIDHQWPGVDTLTGYGRAFLGAPPATHRPIFDFDATGRSDTFWRNDRLGASVIALMDGTSIENYAALPPNNPGKRVATVGYFNDDRQADLLWFDPATSVVELRLTAGSGVAGRWRLERNWIVAGSGDFNGDGTDDLFFRNTVNGINCIWLLRDGAIVQTYALDSAAERWKVVAIGDMNDDGRADILWRSSFSGRYQPWLLNGRQVRSKQFLRETPGGSGWQVQGLADFDGDGTDDLLWQNTGDGSQRGWVRVDYLRNGQPTRAESLYQVRNDDYQVVALADYNGDQRADLLWRNMATGGLYLFLHNGSSILAERALPGGGLGWSVIGASTYDGQRPAVAGGTPQLQGGAALQQNDDIAPSDPTAPIGDTPAEPNPGRAPADPNTPDPGTEETSAGELIDTITLPTGATVDEITQLILTLMLVEEPSQVYMPMVFR